MPAFNTTDLTFSLEVRSNTEAAFKLDDNMGQAVEVVFLCGRTSGTPGDLQRVDLDELKSALRDLLAQL